MVGSVALRPAPAAKDAGRMRSRDQGQGPEGSRAFVGSRSWWRSGSMRTSRMTVSSAMLLAVRDLGIGRTFLLDRAA